MPQKKSANAPKKQSEDFEKSMDQLEKIVQQLEEEKLPIEKSIEQFERGVKLYRTCHQRLNEIEKKVEVLLKADDEGIETEPFED